MRGMSRLATGATLAAAVSLTTLIVILLFLLVSLFCSLAREKRHQCRNNDDDVAVESEGRPPRPLSFPFYGHGVLRAPTKYLLSVPNLEAAAAKQASPSPSQNEESFVRISNPMYDGTSAAAIEEVGADAGGVVLIEAPKSSAPRFEGDEERFSPPLKLMKKLSSSIVQPKASSALFYGRRSLGGSTETNRPSSSSSSNSPCSSPSW